MQILYLPFSECRIDKQSELTIKLRMDSCSQQKCGIVLTGRCMIFLYSHHH